jgi:hypothetical protein
MEDGALILGGECGCECGVWGRWVVGRSEGWKVGLGRIRIGGQESGC